MTIVFWLVNHRDKCDLYSLAVTSFVELVEYVFTIPGVSVFLSNRLCQDPLEKVFGQQRQRGRVNENPSAKHSGTESHQQHMFQNRARIYLSLDPYLSVLGRIVRSILLRVS